MPTKKIFLMALAVDVGVMFAWSLVRAWSHRHSTSDGLDGLVASTIQVAA